MERRLAVVLAVDVVGYSRLMTADEATAQALAKRQRAALLYPRIAGAKIAACSMAARSMARG